MARDKSSDKDLGDLLGELFSGFGQWEKENGKLEPGKTYDPFVVKTVKSQRGVPMSKQKPGTFVGVRPANDKRTYLGIYLGEMPAWNSFYYNISGQELVVTAHTNPAMFVPDLQRVVYGCESWWGEIADETELRQVTDEDIENVWYVKALKQISERRKGEGK